VPVSIVTRGGAATRAAARIAVPITIVRNGRLSISNDVFAGYELQLMTGREL